MDQPANSLLNLYDWFPYRDDHDTNNMQFYNLLDMNRVWSSFSELGFHYFDPIDEYLSLWDCWEDSHLPLMLSYNEGTCGETKVATAAAGGGSADHGGRNGWRRSRPLEMEEIEKHFEMPMTKAAENLSVGLTMLKKRCRELNIKRWPHRKLKSIKSLIQNVKEMGLVEEMEMLEEQKMMIKKLPEMDLTQRTKKLRQACFKATYKKRRSDNSSH